MLRLHFGDGVLRRGQSVAAAATDSEQLASQDTPLRPNQNKHSVCPLGHPGHPVPRSEQSIVPLTGSNKGHHPRLLPRLLLLLLSEK